MDEFIEQPARWASLQDEAVLQMDSRRGCTGTASGKIKGEKNKSNFIKNIVIICHFGTNSFNFVMKTKLTL